MSGCTSCTMTIRSRVPPPWTTYPRSHGESELRSGADVPCVAAQVNPRRRPGIEQLNVDIEVFLLDPVSDSMVILTRAAGQVWELCDGSRAIEEVIAQLAADFNLPAAELATAVRSAVQE